MSPRFTAGQTGRPRRVAFYSHDTQGLGHVRRNIAIAASIVADDPGTEVLLLTGNPETTRLPLPAHTEVVTLPTVGKRTSGAYHSRVLLSPLTFTVALRREILRAALTGFAPDLLVVDKVPLGFAGELEPTLGELRAGQRTAVVLGLREVLDEPSVAMNEWESMDSSRAVADYYDAVWVYGDRSVYDLVEEYRLPPEVAGKVSYTGYLARGREAGTATSRSSSGPPRRPFVLCTVGGGQDGFELAQTFVSTSLPAGHLGIVLSGPFMKDAQRQRLQLLARANPGMAILDFVPNPEHFMREAAATVSMAGYNSVCEVLAANRPTLLVPRTTPRAEQFVRARQLADRGLVDLALPAEVTPSVLARWMAEAVQRTGRSAHPVDLDGLGRIPALADNLWEGLAHAV
nr:glycosyltransferase [uncultured Friedmanniella sp.]